MNNYWEDLNMSEELKAFHEKESKKMGVPEWALVNCPFCGHKLNHRAIRSIAMLFNARNIGDVAVEFCCDECVRSDTLYFRKAADDIKEFAHLIDEGSYGFSPKNSPLIEEKMYTLQYNNLVENHLLHKEN